MLEKIKDNNIPENNANGKNGLLDDIKNKIDEKLLDLYLTEPISDKLLDLTLKDPISDKLWDKTWKTAEKEAKEEYQKSDFFGETEKGREMTFTEADSGNVNPNFEECEGFQCNCQTCVVVFEARLRGWDIEAMPFKEGSNSDKLSLNTNLAWLTPNGKHPDYKYDTTANNVDSVYNFIDKTVNPGERYTLEGQWKGFFNGGHIISVFREPTGNLVFYDPQVNKIYNERSFKIDILSNMQKGTTPDTNIKLLRIDNLAIDKTFMDPLVRRSESYA